MTPKNTTVAATLLFILVVSPTGSAKVVYVAADAIEVGSGTSWADPARTITAGLALSASGDELWVKTATYEERVEMKEGVALYGGFDGTEVAREERNFLANETLIRTQSTAEFPYGLPGADHALLDGFTITDISGDWTIVCLETSPTIANCTIRDCPGMGIYCARSSPIIRDCTITNNEVGVECYSYHPIIENCLIEGNSRYGIYYSDSGPVIRGCRILFNETGIGTHYSGNPNILDCTIIGNSVGIDGVAYADAGPYAENCRIEQNSWGTKGTVYLNDCSISENLEGGIYDGTSLSLTRCRVANNSGNGVSLLPGRSNGITNCLIVENAGFGIESTGGKAYVTHSTFSGNSLGSFRTQVYVVCNYPPPPPPQIPDCTSWYPDLYLRNCIVWDENPLLNTSPSAVTSVVYSCVRGGWQGEHNTELDPLFVSPDLGDYHLANGSPCIDTGTVLEGVRDDLEGNPRPGDDGLVDMGAYESPDEYEPDPPRLVYHVRKDAPPGGDGLSWETAFTSIREALGLATSLDQVWVASGNYTEQITRSRRAATIYGGFRGDESSPDGRNPLHHETVIRTPGNISVGECLLKADGLTFAGTGELTGRAIRCDGGSLSLSNCRFVDLSADFGAAIYVYGAMGPSSIKDCTFERNRVASGGVLYQTSAEFPMTLIRCLFAGNQAEGYGGALNGQLLSIVNSTFVENTSVSGSALHLSEGSSIVNSILWNPGVEIGYFTSLPPTVSHSCIQDGWPGSGNIDESPRFEDPENGDWRLQDGSPCINAGIDVGLPFNGSAPDMGAYESPAEYLPEPTSTVTPTPTVTATPTVTPTPTPVPGDLTGDGVTDARDLFYFASRWKHEANGENGSCDLQPDGTIDEEDLSCLIWEMRK